jgi:hypothetical protein
MVFMYANMIYAVYTLSLAPYGKRNYRKETINECFLVLINYH